MWRNWYTHSTQNAAGNHVGSSPTIGTKNKKHIVDVFFILWNAMVGTRKGRKENCPVDSF